MSMNIRRFVTREDHIQPDKRAVGATAAFAVVEDGEEEGEEPSRTVAVLVVAHAKASRTELAAASGSPHVPPRGITKSVPVGEQL